MKLSHFVRLCKIDTKGDESIDLLPEQPRWAIRYLPKREYGAHILMIHLGYCIIELATGEGK